MLSFDDLLSYNMSPYAVFESHISYMFEPCYDNIYNFINRLLYDASLLRQYINTGARKLGFAYSTTKFKCIKTSVYSDDMIPVYIDIVSTSNNYILGSIENTG